MFRKLMNWLRPAPQPVWRFIPDDEIAKKWAAYKPPQWRSNLHGLSPEARSERSRKAAATRKRNRESPNGE